MGQPEQVAVVAIKLLVGAQKSPPRHLAASNNSHAGLHHGRPDGRPASPSRSVFLLRQNTAGDPNSHAAGHVWLSARKGGPRPLFSMLSLDSYCFAHLQPAHCPRQSLSFLLQVPTSVFSPPALLHR